MVEAILQGDNASLQDSWQEDCSRRYKHQGSGICIEKNIDFRTKYFSNQQ